MSSKTIDKRLDLLEEALIREALNREWQHKYAKFGKRGSQSLFAHSVNVFSVARTLGEHLFDLGDDEELYLSCLAGFLHDYQKAEPEWQDAAVAFVERGETSSDAFEHDSGSPEMMQRLSEILRNVETYISEISGSVTDLQRYAERSLNIVVYTHDAENRAVASRRRMQVGPIDTLSKTIRLCDSISSIKEAKGIISKTRDPDLPRGKQIKFEYHEISEIRGLVSSFLNQAAIQLMKKYGYVPLLHFGNGTAYLLIGEPRPISNPKQRIMTLIDEQFKIFQDSDAYEAGMTNAVIGVLTQTKWPCIQVVREKDVPDLVRYISSMPAMNKKPEYGKSYFKSAQEKAEYKSALDDFVKRTGSERDAITATMVSDFNLIVYFADFIKNYRKFAESADVVDEYTADVDEWLSAYLGGFTVEELSSISLTSPVPARIGFVRELWKLDTKPLHLSKDRRETIVTGCISVLKRVVRKYKRIAPPTFSQSAKERLLVDLSHMPVDLLDDGEIKEIASHSHSRYASGKSKTKRICNLCGAPGENDAPAPLFGDGSQKFSNFLPGGVKLGKWKKAQVCPVCMVEATLRAFFFPSSPYSTMVLLPDLSLSPSMYRQWSNAVQEVVRTEKLGMSIGTSWNMPRVYRALARGTPLDNSYHLARMLRPTSKNVTELAVYLQHQRETPREVRYSVINEKPEKNTFESLAEAHLGGRIAIDARILQGYRVPSRTQNTCYMTPSHMLVFFRYRTQDDKNESKSTSILRTYLLSLILTKVFQARVIFLEGFQPVNDFSLEGVVSVQTPAPATNALNNLGIGNIVRIHEVQRTLKKLASLTLVALNYVEGLGKDRLLRLASMNRGAILRRAQMEKGSEMRGQTKRILVDLLTELAPVPGNISG